jgi:alkanesulfonate monooxygenase
MAVVIEFIGTASTREESEAIEATGPPIQPDWVRKLALAHEDSGFDYVLTAMQAYTADSFTVAAQILSATTRLGVLVAHRPGFVAPTQAARKFATLEAFHPSRVAVHVITGGDDADQARDGDYVDKPSRYRRTDEFLTVVRQEWASETQFDFEGEFYRVTGAHSVVRPTGGAIPIFFGGATSDAVQVGAKHADTYLFWGEPLEGIKERIAAINEAAAPLGRRLSFGVGLRPIVGDTEQHAWQQAEEILARSERRVQQYAAHDPSGNHGRERLMAFAEKRDLYDGRLWTKIAQVTKASGNSTAVVGAYEQVAEALMEYIKIGVSSFFIRGYFPYEDAVAYRRLIALVRETAAKEGIVVAGASNAR